MTLIFRQASNEVTGLAAAAARAFEVARKGHLPIVYIAERASGGQAQFWLANSLLRTVCAVGRRPGRAQREKVRHEDLAGLTLASDMNALSVAGESEPRYIDLGLSAGELRRYLEWMRTVQ